MNWSDVKPWIAKLAPWLGGALGGPMGATAGKLIGDALGIKDAKPEDIAEAMKTGSLSGDQIISLKKIEQDFQVQMQSLQINSVKDLEALAVQDRASAREREIRTGDSWTPRILAGVVVIGWLLVQFFILKHIIPAEMREIIMRSMGTLDMALGLVLGYYFGSSSGSDTKTHYLANKSE